MNHMKDVAKLLGVKFREKFKIACENGVYYLDKKGLYNIDYEFYDDNFLVSLLNGELEIHKFPILNDNEKKILSEMLKPYMDKRIGFIYKSDNGKFEHILICYTDDKDNKEYERLSDFEIGTMFRGMDSRTHYTLKELGL